MPNDIISRELAICILFCTEYNETNVSLLTKRINDMRDMEVVYENDSEMPVLLPLIRYNAHPIRYHKYIAEERSVMRPSTENKMLRR
ncbi:hypothetical protein G6F57_005590 [Rhizopus arrhizus]|uniref:Uncharacterized protein n=1 Tax=Rhizopus oryzae TaxID=64495 RepID=A0A9P6X9H8_RHIOR|nr:hypothetical protein G6F23_009045 [Rhizopus arrhizus]KAG1218345.1 hypothetical protein G6F68_021604 [Rhizopus microsporus]KAG1400783.1 hypothetical protein G6F58_010879 [Rhizopus delemar]KAG0763289.1 hypothetical protein G6F24_006141 [Rhizopus arrhizus]KAG0792945.1 hypothetical protein G6F21_003983 [Rhizopus arrhizus]